MSRERERLDLERDSHLEVAVDAAMVDERVELACRRVDVVKVLRRVLGVDVLARDLEVRERHLGEGPGRRFDDGLAKRN